MVAWKSSSDDWHISKRKNFFAGRDYHQHELNVESATRGSTKLAYM